MLRGTRVGETLRGERSGCVQYRASLVANRQNLATDDALLTSQSEWLMRPVGSVARAELHVALSPAQQVATAWPALDPMDRSLVQRVGRDAEGTHTESFSLPPLALERLREQLSARDVAITRFWVAKEAAAKARGTGLAGNPSRFVVREVMGDRLLVVFDEVGREVGADAVHMNAGLLQVIENRCEIVQADAQVRVVLPAARVV